MDDDIEVIQKDPARFSFAFTAVRLRTSLSQNFLDLINDRRDLTFIVP
jgi:hypothetical protein